MWFQLPCSQFGSDRDDWASSIAIDSDGSIYVAGVTRGTLPGQTSAQGQDFFLCQYDPRGVELWTRQFGFSQFDEVWDVAVSRERRVYVVGFTRGTLSGQTGEVRGGAFVMQVKCVASTGTTW